MKFCRETIATIIDVFEDFLESKGVRIENGEHEGNEGEAIIYGSDFDNLMDGVIGTLELSGIHTSRTFDAIEDNHTTELVILVPSAGQIIRIDIGTGDNLLPEDTAKGYVDYLNYDIYEADEICDTDSPSDGGMILLKEMALDKYKSLLDTVPEVLDMAYGNTDLSWIEISGGTEFNIGDD